MAQLNKIILSRIIRPIVNNYHRQQLNVFQRPNYNRYLSNQSPNQLEILKSKDKIDSNEQKLGTLNLSESCIKRLKEICQDGSFLRITVEGGGCSGFTYKFDLDKKINDDDIIFNGQDSNSKVVIDSTSLEYCSGATVDYHTELIRAGFRIINNPKAEAGCSCGASFALRLD